MRREYLYYWVIIPLMVALAVFATIKGFGKECVLICGFAAATNCMRFITIQNTIKSWPVWYFSIVLSVGIGFVYPLVPVVTVAIIFGGINLHFAIGKKEVEADV